MDTCRCKAYRTLILHSRLQVGDNVAAVTANAASAAGVALMNAANPASDALSRRCVTLLKTAFRPELWADAELKLNWFEKLLVTVESVSQPNFQNICTAIDLLAFLLTILRKESILAAFKPLQRGIASCMVSTNSKVSILFQRGFPAHLLEEYRSLMRIVIRIRCTRFVVVPSWNTSPGRGIDMVPFIDNQLSVQVLRSVHSLLSRLMGIFPAEATSPKHEELEYLYSQVFKVVTDGLTNYEK